MAEVKVRKLDDWVLRSHKAAADAAGRSLEEELRRVLTEAAERRRQKLIADIMAFQEQLAAKYGELPDSTPLIRADRDRRG